MATDPQRHPTRAQPMPCRLPTVDRAAGHDPLCPDRADARGGAARGRLHRARRRLRGALVVLRALHDDGRRAGVAAVWPFRRSGAAARRRAAPRPHPAAHRRRLRRTGSEADRSLHDAGRLPNFSRLAKTGCYRRLRTTFPSVSPVAWSSFSTGTHPARHNIFDFLDRDRRTYLPRAVVHAHRQGRSASSASARYRIPRQRPELRLLRKSKPFWTILGEHRIWSTILRVPITFPPDRFYGAELSAMCVPDLLGTQGTFLLFTTRPAGRRRFKEGGIRIPVDIDGDRVDTTVEGPENTFVAGNPPLTLAAADRARPQRPRGRRRRSARHARDARRPGS